MKRNYLEAQENYSIDRKLYKNNDGSSQGVIIGYFGPFLSGFMIDQLEKHNTEEMVKN